MTDRIIKTPHIMDKKKIKEEEKDYRGADVNIADDERDTEKLQKQDTCMLNNNPRNDDGPQP